MKKGVNRAAEDGKKQYKKNPGQFIGRFFLLVQNVDAYDNTESFQDEIHITKGHVCSGYEKEDKGQLNKYQRYNKNTPSEDDADPVFFHCIKAARDLRPA